MAMTVADRVRYMSDEQLAKLAFRFMMSGCLMMMRFPGTDRQWIEDHKDDIEGSILKELREDESTRDWSWLNEAIKEAKP